MTQWPNIPIFGQLEIDTGFEPRLFILADNSANNCTTLSISNHPSIHTAYLCKVTGGRTYLHRSLGEMEGTLWTGRQAITGQKQTQTKNNNAHKGNFWLVSTEWYGTSLCGLVYYLACLHSKNSPCNQSCPLLDHLQCWVYRTIVCYS